MQVSERGHVVITLIYYETIENGEETKVGVQPWLSTQANHEGLLAQRLIPGLIQGLMINQESRERLVSFYQTLTLYIDTCTF